MSIMFVIVFVITIVIATYRIGFEDGRNHKNDHARPFDHV